MLLADYARLTVALGPRRVTLNLLHRLRLKSGWYRHSNRLAPLALLPMQTTESARSVFTTPVGDLHIDSPSAQRLREATDRIIAGEFLYFSRHWIRRPPTWRTSPLSGYKSPDLHWVDCQEFSPDQGDVKWIWEASRFDWAYVLGRAWHHFCDERAARTFWRLLDDWVRDNPPNTGVNWRCGQECSLRLIALVWAAAAFHDSTETTPHRRCTLWSLVAALAARVQTSLGYAVSQNNNHGLIEASALHLAGSCLERHPGAQRWRRLGRRLFLKQVEEQFAHDGFYVQNSFNYTRLALRACVVYLLSARLTHEALEDRVSARIRAAARLLRAAMNPQTGRVPNYGANDGTNIVSLSGAEYLDFRPVLQSIWYLLTGRRLLSDATVADEELAWLGAGDIAHLPVEGIAPPAGHAASASGYFVLASGDSRLHVRCATHRARPGHADMLHADIWYGSVNLARDGGTFQYFDARDWGVVLAGSAAHNVVVVDGRDQMRRLSRFLWTDWTRAQVISAEVDSDVNPGFSGVHFGYGSRGVHHRRTIHGRGGEWLIIDDLLYTDAGQHELALHWHLDENLKWCSTARGMTASRGNYLLDVAVRGEPSFECYVSAADLPRNAESLYYGEIKSGCLFIVRVTANVSTRFITAVGYTPLSCADDIAGWHDLSVPLKID